MQQYYFLNAEISCCKEKATIRNFRIVQTEGTILTEQYFEEQLQHIRKIRRSETKFYQKITDIYATDIVYDVNATATRRFFNDKNKLHWAIHGQNAAGS